MISPCTKVCVMDAENRYCRGCNRTLDEIVRWSEMTDQEREQVMASMPLRSPREAASS